MASGLVFEWDDGKAESNLAKHGVPFAFAVRVFFDPTSVEFDVSREADQERRHKLVGMIHGRLYTVVFTRRDQRVRIISGRPSNRSEEVRYGTFRT